MFRILPALPTFIRELPFYFSPTDKKIKEIVERLKDPNVKVVVFSESKSRFKVIRNGAILVSILSLLKKDPPPEKKPVPCISPFYSPYNQLIDSLKNIPVEKKNEDFGIQAILEFLKKALDHAYSLVDVFSFPLLSNQLKIQLKEAERLRQENTLLKQENKDMKSFLEVHFAEQKASLKTMQENVSKVFKALEKQNEKFDSIKLLFSPALQEIQSQKEKIDALGEKTKSMEKLLEKIESQLCNLEEKATLSKEEVKELTNSLLLLHIQQKTLASSLKEQKDLLKKMSFDIQKIEEESGKSFLEKIKKISPDKFSFFTEEIVKS